MSMTVGINGVTFPDGSSQITATQYGMKNRIINGAMVIDKRFAGSAATISTPGYTYVVDRFAVYATQGSKLTAQQNQNSVTPPAGFTNYLGVTSSSSYSVLATDIFGIVQTIEGYNTADLAWGTANAKTVTLSFWVRSSLTGTFGGSLINSGFTRAYPFTYAINAANTWEQKTITVSGETTGGWAVNNVHGIRVWFGLGCGTSQSTTPGAWANGEYESATGATSVVGTNGATFYITGVQLEKSSTATAFDYRAYSTELAMCQRYYFSGAVIPIGAAFARRDGGNLGILPIKYPTTMRATPTGGTTGTWQYYSDASVWTNVAGGTQIANPGDVNYGTLDFGIGTNATPTLGSAWYVRLNNGTYSFSAEL